MTYLIQIDDEIREATPEEVQQIEASKSENLSERLEAKAVARQSALAKLAALGLTEEEIAAL